jgi:hypothetical protein
MADAKRDQNFVPTLLGVSNADGVTPVAVYADPVTHRLLVDLPTGTGTVTSVSVVSANGFAGTVATATSTPAITLSTTITGVLYGNGTSISALTIGSGLQLVGTTLSTTGGGTGDVVGPASATDNAVARFDLATGKLIQNSVVLIADTTGVISGTQGVTFSGATSGTTALVPTAVAGTTTLTLPAATDTLVGLATTDTLTNKTLTSPKINENVVLTTTATKLNYLTSATGTTGTTSTNVVFSTSPVLTTPTVATTINPSSNDGAALGASGTAWSDLFLATGGVINWNAGDVTITHGLNDLQFAGAAEYGFTGGNVIAYGAGVIGGSFLGVYDTNGTHQLRFSAGSDLTANRTLTFTTGDSDRTFTLSGNLTVESASLVNQDLTTDASPQFTAIELGAASDTTLARVSAGVVSIEGVNIMTVGANQTATGQNKFNNIIDVNNAITASANAATVPVTYRLSTVTNNSAATLTITMTTASAVDGQMTIVRILDFSAVAQTITWVNTENSTVSAPTTSNGSTTLPLTVGFMYNSATSKWRCIASA